MNNDKIKLILGRILYKSIISEFIFKITRTHFKHKVYSNTILIFSLNRLGDTVFTIPSIEKVYRYYKNYKIYLICYKSSIPIYKYYFKNSIEFIPIKNNLNWFLRHFPSLKLIKQLRILKPQIFFDISPSYLSFLLNLLIGANINVGMNRNHLKTGYDKYLEKRKLPHLIDMYMDVVNMAIPEQIPEMERAFTLNYNKNDYIFLSPLAGWKAKEWGIDNFIKLYVELNNHHKVKFIYEKGSINNELVNRNNIEFIETSTIQELIDKLHDCSLLIGNDSGPIYIANMLGKPTFTIYGPTNPAYSLPYGSHHRYIRKEIHCTPFIKQYCHLRGGLDCPVYDCLNLLTVKDVYDKIIKFIDELKNK